MDDDDQTCRRHIVKSLEALVDHGHLTPPDRAQAGIALAQLGDLRKGVGVRPEDGLPNVDFTTKQLPPGKFKLGEGGKPVGIKQAYRLSRYPVTVAQFQAFVDRGGYGEPEGPKPSWWSDAGWQWRNGRSDTSGWPSWRRDEYEKGTFPILRPKDYDPVFQTANHPRVGVSWYEAMAFCGWLTEQLYGRDALPRIPEVGAERQLGPSLLSCSYCCRAHPGARGGLVGFRCVWVSELAR